MPMAPALPRRLLATAVAALGMMPTMARANGLDSASATVTSYPCAAVDPDVYTRQSWSPGSRPYGIPFAQWDEAALDALKARMAACMTPANRQRTQMMLRYIDGPYGSRAQVRQAVERQAAIEASRTASIDQIRGSLDDLLSSTSPVSRSSALDRIGMQIDTSRLLPEQKEALRRELEHKRQEVAEQELAEANRRAQAAREREAQAAAEQQAREQRQKHDEEVAAQAEQQRQQRAAQERAAAEQAQAEAAAEAERFFAQHRGQLSPELVSFLERNPELKAPDTRDAVLRAIETVEGEIACLEICRAHNEGYSAEWTESQRRLGVLQQLLIGYHGETPDALAKAATSRRTKLISDLKQELDDDDELRAHTCGAVLTESAQLADFNH